MIRMKASLLLFLSLTLFACSSNAQSTAASGVFIKLKLADTNRVKIDRAPLKYNKHLALSFTLDDGYRSAYLTAFPLLNGGKVSGPMPDEWKNDEGGDGQESKGFFYTDGNGKLIPFKIGLAINAGKIGDKPKNRGHLSWAELAEMNKAGWDLINHGYNHLTKPGNDFALELTKNTDTVQKRLGVTMTQCAVPGGEHEEGYELVYEDAAFANGSFGISSYKGVPSNWVLTTDLNLKDFVYERTFLQSDKDSTKPFTVDEPLGIWDSLMRQPLPVWNNSFTHGVGNTNLWGLSLFYPEFKYYMNSLNKRYGSVGNDRIWVASVQEVYEYLWLMQHISIDTKQHGDEITISLDVPGWPEYFKYKTVTLKINSDAPVTVADFDPALKNISKGEKVDGTITFDLY
jgi:hypothetical protein